MNISAGRPVNAFQIERGVHGIGYRPDVDGLRSVAVLSVVIFHAFPTVLPGGFIGVDIFFVISGFLISTILLEALNRGRFNLLDFYGRRARRIFPALAIVLAATAAFGWFALLPEEYKELGKHIAGGAGFVSNLVLWQESGYFDSAAETKPLLHLWSLGIEEQFYIVWPAILWAAFRFRLPKLPIILLVAALSFIANMVSVHAHPVATFYSPLTRIWELLIGAALAQVSIDGRGKHPSFFGAAANRMSASNLTGIAGAALIGVALARLSPSSAFPGWRALFPSVGTALLILSAAGNWVNWKLLSNRPMVWVGRISFPLYLWHWPLLAFARIIEGDTPSLEIRLSAILVAFPLATATYLLIETNIRHKWKSRAVTMTLTYIVCIVGMAGYSIHLYNGAPMREGVALEAKIHEQLEGTTWKYTSNDICKAKYPTNFRYFCTQTREGSPTLILLGDSYANALVAGLVVNPATQDEVVLSYGSCDPSASAGDLEIKTQCETQDRIISETPGLRYAILESKWPRFDSSGRLIDYFTKVPINDAAWAPRYRDGLDKRISFLESRGIKVFLFGPKPEIDYEPKYCFARPFRQPVKNCQMTETEVQEQQHELSLVLRDVLAKHPNVTFFDPNPAFCKNGTCSLKTQDGLPMLRDKVHYSQYGSAIAIDLFVKQAQREGYFRGR
ncbi:acyltransferase family protein [Rhizobium laguerreae]|uniref:acyltransferase family protein n=1 Tax=Rhizobium laguerreae TaxID=1076926 RepID=UPI001C92AC76|nr:acyltransferase family protein [Rhizobium laguerreae]MBY3193460.1 acyltransferase [Rhizobium laguerreae]